MSPDRQAQGFRDTRLPLVPAPAREHEAVDIARLLRRCRPETVAVPVETIRRSWRRHLVVRVAGLGVVATAAIHDLDRRTSELRSLAVDPRWRGLGLGAELVRRVVRDAARRGRDLLCVTLRPKFFARHGFRRVPLDERLDKPDRPEKVEGRERVAMLRSSNVTPLCREAWRR